MVDRANIVQQIGCGGNDKEICQKSNVGTTKNRLKTRIYGHKSDTKEGSGNSEQKTALAAHCLQEKHQPNWEDIKILEQENNYRKRYTLEMLHIINLEEQERLNFKRDTDNCAHIYKTLVEKHKTKINTKGTSICDKPCNKKDNRVDFQT